MSNTGLKHDKNGRQNKHKVWLGSIFSSHAQQVEKIRHICHGNIHKTIVARFILVTNTHWLLNWHWSVEMWAIMEMLCQSPRNHSPARRHPAAPSLESEDWWIRCAEVLPIHPQCPAHISEPAFMWSPEARHRPEQINHEILLSELLMVPRVYRKTSSSVVWAASGW